jgi:folate-binding Fe-S cluster repair protein YgfZ
VSTEFTQALRERGASCSEGIPTDFGDPAAELRASIQSCALIDRSSLSRLQGRGPDLLDLLHRLSTADIKGLTEGQGRPTVLTSAKGRIVERLCVHHLGAEGVLLVAGPEAGPRVLDHLARYTFAEKTGLAEITGDTVLLALTGLMMNTLEESGLILIRLQITLQIQQCLSITWIIMSSPLV